MGIEQWIFLSPILAVCIVCGAMFMKWYGFRLSVFRLSVCRTMGPLQQQAHCCRFVAVGPWWAGDISWLLSSGVQQTNAGSATLSSYRLLWRLQPFSYCNTKWWTLQNDTSFTRTSYLGCSHSNRSWIRLVQLSVIISGVLLKMKVGIRKGAWRRAWRYPAYLWSLRWVYAVKKTRRLVYSVYPRIPPNTPLVIIDSAVLLMTVIQANCHAKWSVDPATFLAIVYLCDWPIQSMICWTISIIVWPY